MQELAEPSDDLLLTIKFDNKNPIDLNDLGHSLNSLADEYCRFSKRHSAEASGKLYVREVRKGSVIIDLISSVPVLLPIAEKFNSVFEFAKYIQGAFEFLTDKSSAKPEGADSRTYDNIANFVAPMAGNAGSSVSVSVVNNGTGSVSMFFGATEGECTRIKTKAGYEKERMRMPGSNLYEMETMYLFQARNENKSKTGDKGVIEAISGSPKRLIFASEEIKAQIMEGDENLFHFIYVVDVVVEVREGKPVAYKVIKFHERFKDE